ncbi:unnamed protein product [Protopolystoma xenopodis]|uniref:Uncharacterized protein n=1 Tax=Protopolystoma xenopodis TaxID=117903 RepID=A0A3S5BQI5_9PLAT|nr:unnamed protein product [Protopolystoma xenopodis]
MTPIVAHRQRQSVGQTVHVASRMEHKTSRVGEHEITHHTDCQVTGPNSAGEPQRRSSDQCQLSRQQQLEVYLSQIRQKQDKILLLIQERLSMPDMARSPVEVTEGEKSENPPISLCKMDTGVGQNGQNTVEMADISTEMPPNVHSLEDSAQMRANLRGLIQQSVAICAKKATELVENLYTVNTPTLELDECDRQTGQPLAVGGVISLSPSSATASSHLSPILMDLHKSNLDYECKLVETDTGTQQLHVLMTIDLPDTIDMEDETKCRLKSRACRLNDDDDADDADAEKKSKVYLSMPETGHQQCCPLVGDEKVNKCRHHSKWDEKPFVKKSCHDRSRKVHIDKLHSLTFRAGGKLHEHVLHHGTNSPAECVDSRVKLTCQLVGDSADGRQERFDKCAHEPARRNVQHCRKRRDDKSASIRQMHRELWASEHAQSLGLLHSNQTGYYHTNYPSPPPQMSRQSCQEAAKSDVWWPSHGRTDEQTVATLHTPIIWHTNESARHNSAEPYHHHYTMGFVYANIICPFAENAEITPL